MESSEEEFKKDQELIKAKVKIFNDFPKPGIAFYDLFSILEDSSIRSAVIKSSITLIKKGVPNFNTIVGLEARGLMLGFLFADLLKVRFVPARKKGKLPGECASEDFSLEYGKDSFEIQKSLITKDSKVLIIDDLLATGGSLLAVEKLVIKLGGEIAGYYVIFKNAQLKGETKLQKPAKLINMINI